MSLPPSGVPTSELDGDEEVTRIFNSEPSPEPWQVSTPGSAQRDEYSLQELQARWADGRLSRDALVWPPNGDAWIKATELTELKRTTGTLPPLPVLPIPTPPPAMMSAPPLALDRNTRETTPPSRSPSERAAALAKANILGAARRSYRAGADFVEGVFEQVPFERMSNQPRALAIAGGASFFFVLTIVLLVQVFSLKAEVSNLRRESEPELGAQTAALAAAPTDETLAATATTPAPVADAPATAAAVTAPTPAPAPTTATEPIVANTAELPAASEPALTSRSFAPSSGARAVAPAAKPQDNKPIFTAGFDFDKAKQALRAAAGRASGCGNDNVSGSGSVMVNFAPSGRASGVTILTPKFQTGAPAGCIRGAFSGLRIPPFAGPAKSVKKSFNVQ